MFVFGSQYLRGATPERDQWEKDMENMKKLGFNTIRAWLVWNAIELREGEIDRKYITDFLDCAKKYDLQVGLLFHMHACPAWAVKKFSKYFYVNEDNLPFEPAVRPNTPSGGWPGLCFDHPEVREMEERFISAVISETKKYDNVAFYEPINEPHSWIDYQHDPAKIFCYCPATVEKFKKWLERKYQTIENLNNAWGFFYSSFDEIRPPRWTASYCDYMDFRLFTMDNLAEEVAFRTQLIKKYDNKPVFAHAWGGGSATCVNLGAAAFDDWKSAAVVDKWGYSAFPKTAAECSMLGLSSHANRCVAGDKDYWQSELSAGSIGNAFREFAGRIDDNTFYKFSLESIRHGAKGLLYWQYRKERIGEELGGFAMTDFDGGETNLTRCAGRLGKMLKENGELLNNRKSINPEVAIVYSVRSHLADWTNNEKKGTKFPVDSMSGYHRVFWEENIPIDVLHEEFSDNLDKYKLIILSCATALSPEFAEKLKEYIRNGGTIISEPSFGMFDKTFKLSYTVPGIGFDKIFGCNEDDMRTCKTLTLTDGKSSFEITGNRYIETFRNVTGKALYSYEDGSPAIISNSYGKGTAIISGINLGFINSERTLVADDYTSTDEVNTCTFARDFILSLCKGLGIKGNICTAKDVKVSLISTKDESLMIMINSAHENRSGEVVLDNSYCNFSVVLGNCDASIADGKFTFKINADESAVIRFK